MDLMREINMRLSLEGCVELCPALEELGFLWLAEPVRTSLPDALKKVNVSGGEFAR
jgi:L-alanine-DL-glutamate epimerase-like enolase superfamily enzyme